MSGWMLRSLKRVNLSWLGHGLQFRGLRLRRFGCWLRCSCSLRCFLGWSSVTSERPKGLKQCSLARPDNIARFVGVAEIVDQPSLLQSPSFLCAQVEEVLVRLLNQPLEPLLKFLVIMFRENLLP